MNGTVENYSRLLTTTGASKNVKTRNGVALKRLSGGSNLDILGVLLCKVVQPLQVITVRVVRVEPGAVGRAGCQLR